MTLPENTTIYVMRHGLATRREDGYGQDILTARLLPEGIADVEKAAVHLQAIKPDLAVASPVLRCQQTAEIVTRIAGHTFQTEPRLTEFHSETVAELATRVTSWLETVADLAPNTVLVCTHGSVISAIQHLILDDHFTEAEVFMFPRPAGLLKISQGQVETLLTGTDKR